uniref:Uncharacterized protein n=1 Tax=Siphoviridae sp. ctDhw1 TaxID=2827813 RepID=A0A8S5SIR4_9CAUD|nr:MAG TPA: hypothetical protein [Siphoviridae sp. ctDhw1]DAO99966.1 MAG TPA: hypothetical protein [Caudoviricetes sp.]
MYAAWLILLRYWGKKLGVAPRSSDLSSWWQKIVRRQWR